MSYAVGSRTADRSALLVEAPYLPSDPRNPALPLVGDAFRVMLLRSVEALRECLVPISHSYEELRQAIQIERLLSVLSPYVQVPRPDDVRQYLMKHPDMAAVVGSTCERARRNARSPLQLSLELYRDPEIDDEYLSLYLRQPTYGKELLRLIEHLNRQSDVEMKGRSGWMLISTDFHPPM